MTSSEQAQSDVANNPSTADQAASKNVAKPETSPSQIGITTEQAEQILSQLKSLKQNVFILTLVAGFFALRAILFHR